MGKTVYDMVVIVGSVIVIAHLAILTVGLFCARKRSFLAARGAYFIMVMCTVAIFHIIAVTVTDQHDAVLEAAERLSCVLWGYWCPYIAVGAWLTAKYLQVFTNFWEMIDNNPPTDRQTFLAFVIVPPLHVFCLWYIS
jgi:hypothetical protein